MIDSGKLLPEFSSHLQQAICEAYSLPETTLFEPLTTSQNRTLTVRVSGSLALRILRIYRNSWRTPEAINAELQVLRYIGQNSDLLVPCPFLNNYGEFLTTGVDQGVSFRAALFSYVGGKSAMRLTRSRAYQLGKTLARLDRLLSQADDTIVPTPSASRLVWDHRSLVDWALEQLRKDADLGVMFDTTDRRLPSIEDLAKRLRTALISVYNLLPRQLVHADATFDNLKFSRYGIGILDFDEMGFGPRIYELTSPLCSRLMLDAPSAYVDLLIEGYASETQFTDLELRSVPLFVATRLFGSTGWAAAHRDVSWTYNLLHDSPLRLSRVANLLEAFEESEVRLALADTDGKRWSDTD